MRITEKEVTDPFEIGCGLQEPRGGKVGLGREPFQKVSQSRCHRSGQVAEWCQGDWLQIPVGCVLLSKLLNLSVP